MAQIKMLAGELIFSIHLIVKYYRHGRFGHDNSARSLQDNAARAQVANRITAGTVPVFKPTGCRAAQIKPAQAAGQRQAGKTADGSYLKKNIKPSVNRISRQSMLMPHICSISASRPSIIQCAARRRKPFSDCGGLAMSFCLKEHIS
ncbi:hypothetical protein [Aquitalea magnusonii]|uniref:hypothetical protein n=1 Tax=Aquitalea magnusonii TaxID=332411 RepID=UPI0011B72D85|nr:hypothetical protein [Aquitalea magnusonii]